MAVAFIGVPDVYAALVGQAQVQGHFGFTILLNVGALAGFTFVIGAFVPVIRQEADSSNVLVAALVATAAVVPMTVTELVAAVAYIAPHDGFSHWIHWLSDLAVFWGVLAGLLAWLVAASRYRSFATVDRQNARVYADLCQQYVQAVNRLPTETPAGFESTTRRGAREEAQAQLEYVASQLILRDGKRSLEQSAPSLRWVQATGYLDLWNRLHRAEEAILLLEEPEALIADAVYDYMRIQGSFMPARDQLIGKIHWAVNVISPSDAQTLAPVTVAAVVGGSIRVELGPRPWLLTRVKRLFVSQDKRAAVTQAQAILREVRRAIDEYRDNSWDELVRQRNHLVETMIILRVSSFVLLGIAIILGVPVHAITAVIAFYLVGASVGLFNRLKAQPKPDESQPVEDYGLTSVSLLQAALFSGLAAVGGVVITGLLTVPLSKVLAPAAQGHIPALAAVLDLNQNKVGVVIAAIFGLTPQLLLNRLGQITQQYKSAIGGTEASQQQQKSA